MQKTLRNELTFIVSEFLSPSIWSICTHALKYGFSGRYYANLGNIWPSTLDVALTGKRSYRCLAVYPRSSFASLLGGGCRYENCLLNKVSSFPWRGTAQRAGNFELHSSHMTKPSQRLHIINCKLVIAIQIGIKIGAQCQTRIGLEVKFENEMLKLAMSKPYKNLFPGIHNLKCQFQLQSIWFSFTIKSVSHAYLDSVLALASVWLCPHSPQFRWNLLKVVDESPLFVRSILPG